MAASLFALALMGATSQACATEVAKGCDAPPASSRGHTFYIDPQRGSMTNDGSEARPWRTLAEVMAPQTHMVSTTKHRENSSDGSMEAINPQGPIKPGDTLVLMSGDHGDVDIRQYANDDFISVVAGKDQTPLINSLRLSASSHWLFKGLKFQKIRPEADKYRGLVWVETNNFLGPSDNVVFVDDSISTVDSTESWKDQDWVDKPYYYGFVTTGRCTTLSHNHFYNLRNAIAMSGDNSLIEGNLIERFGNDGMDVTSSDLVVRGNLIRDGMHFPTEQLHPDAIQGWGNVRNVLIDSNRVVNFDHPLQGIDVFDGHWENVTIINNLVITTVWHGVAMFGVDNLLIANNTVLRARPEGQTTWIDVQASKDHRPSKNVVVRNNVATMFKVEEARCDHNVAELRFGCKASLQGPRRDPARDRNRVDGGILRSIGFDRDSKTFDLRPTPVSSAYKAGSEESAPSADITGRARVAPYDIGAFAR